MTPVRRAPKQSFPVRPALALVLLASALIALLLQFESPRIAVTEGLESLTSGRTKRTVYVETAPVGGGALAIGGENLSMRFRIGLADRSSMKQFKAVAPAFYGELTRDFSRDPVVADPRTGRLDMLGIEARVQGVLDGLLGAEVVRNVRISEVRRRTI